MLDSNQQPRLIIEVTLSITTTYSYSFLINVSILAYDFELESRIANNLFSCCTKTTPVPWTFLQDNAYHILKFTTATFPVWSVFYAPHGMLTVSDPLRFDTLRFIINDYFAFLLLCVFLLVANILGRCGRIRTCGVLSELPPPKRVT